MKSIPKFNSKKYFSNPTVSIVLVIVVLIAIIFYLDYSTYSQSSTYSQNQDTSEHFSSSYLDLFSYKQSLPPIAKIDRDSSNNLSSSQGLIKSEPVKQIETPKKHVFLQLSKKNFLYTGLIYDKNKNEYMKIEAEQKSPDSIKVYDTDENQIGKYIKNMYNTYHFELALYPDSTIDVSVIDGSYNISVNLSDANDVFYLINHSNEWIDIGYMSKKNIVGRIYFENDTYKINLFDEHKKFMNIIVLALFFYLIHKK